ncbi:Uncharacterized protein APZ42_013881 [Daphnia magna]|uniref:Reverse transcriptase domain-containing protein n=1 Tax=Daphnia magna TaxID=35525 RepID=A0A162QDY6_9CRUS|nr:Uncharacterized protein APZ42_013881 [Daphnia magna]
MPQTLFGSYATQSCRALAQALAVQIQVLVVKLPGEAAVVKIIVHHRHPTIVGRWIVTIYSDRLLAMPGRKSAAGGSVKRRLVSVIKRLAQRDKEARQRDRDRRPRERRSQERDQNRNRSRTPHARSPSSTPLTNFSVCRKSMREFRSWMTSSLKPTEAKQLRESFSPNFINSSFELKCPQFDSSMSRRFKDLNIKGPELSKAEANEKSLRAEQYKVLDVARPLLLLREKMSEKEEFRGSLMANAVDTALRLWGHTFHGITASRRENLLKILDPKFVSLLSKPNRFKTRQCGSLFGRTFIKGMVKEARYDQQLRIISRGSAPSSSRGHGNSSSARGASNGFQRNGSSHGGHYGGSFNNGAYNRGGAARNNSFSNNRYVSYSSVPLFVLDSVIVGARLCLFVDFWKSLSKDPWILSSVEVGVKIDFISPPFQTVAGRNMKMGGIQSEICDREVKNLLEKGAIEPIVSSTEWFISGLFVIPKRSGGFRPIVNLKSLNKFVKPEHFKMEGIGSLQELIRHNDFFVKIDLKDAYLTVLIHPEDKKFFRILWGGGRFVSISMPSLRSFLCPLDFHQNFKTN